MFKNSQFFIFSGSFYLLLKIQIQILYFNSIYHHNYVP